MRLHIQITKDQSAALLALRGGMDKLLAPLARAFHSGAADVLGRAVKNRFKGQGPFPVSQNRLGIVSNRLWKSMRYTALQVDGSTGAASVSMGSNVKYYRGHEFGFRGRVQVKGHSRRGVANSQRTTRGALTRQTINAEKNRIQIRGRKNFSYVRPHARKVLIPARRPLGTELESIQTRLTFFQKFNAAMRRILKTP